MPKKRLFEQPMEQPTVPVEQSIEQSTEQLSDEKREVIRLYKEGKRWAR